MTINIVVARLGRKIEITGTKVHISQEKSRALASLYRKKTSPAASRTFIIIETTVGFILINSYLKAADDILIFTIILHFPAFINYFLSVLQYKSVLVLHGDKKDTPEHRDNMVV